MNSHNAKLLFDKYASINTRITIELLECELDHIINTHFGTTEYNLVAHEELNNSVYTYEVSNKPTDSAISHDDEIADFISKNGDKSYIIQSLLQELCYKNVIPDGTYLIDCTW